LDAGLSYLEAIFTELAQPLFPVDALRMECRIDRPRKLSIPAPVVHDEQELRLEVGPSTP